ncbi:MAG: hypothetical protein JRH18_09610 [Deltaproteobacteria bacterium]|nr:hypothetical protein [Deltaproteobacteria bacterium]MBW1962626.1 hypothetical protein [Deltaproteobacteria bacterium]MBW2151910.1 hypothetical protein [Deltaproteobacteria bacterium]
MIFRSIIGALWAGVYLGGLGARIRRGAGNLRIVEGPDEFDGIHFRFEGAGKVRWMEFMEKNLNRIRSIFLDLAHLVGFPPEEKKYEAPPMMLLSPSTCSIYVGEETADWKAALEKCAITVSGDRCDSLFCGPLLGDES